MTIDQPLSGLRILVVEDMFLVALDLSDRLEGMGCRVVGPASEVGAALRTIEDSALDGALLDVNLVDELSFPVAASLAAHGIPFIFLTGYSLDAFPEEFRAFPRLAKPVDTRLLEQAMSAHFCH